MVDIEELKPHEEVIETLVNKLAAEIRKDDVVRDPLIVDQDYHVILDGMHRFKALKRLKCRFAPCCLLDYMNPQITVGSWFRVFTVERPESVAKETLSSMRLDYSVGQIEVTESALEPATILVTKGGIEFSLRQSIDTFGHCRIATNIEKQLVRSGFKVTYLSESLAMQWLKSERANFVIALPTFTKEIIRRFGLDGVLLPHKVTRHVIPSRPMEIDVPLSLLTEPNISDQRADEKFDDLLERRRIERRPPGSFIDGRRYDEELIVFSS